MTVGHRKGWDAGSKEISTSEGAMQGFRLRGSDNISYHIADIMRSIEAGHRGFLVYDEGVLFILNKMRAEGLIPAETIFKFSVFGGYCSAAGAKVKRLDYFVPDLGEGAEMLEGSTDEIIEKLIEILKAKGGLK